MNQNQYGPISPLEVRNSFEDLVIASQGPAEDPTPLELCKIAISAITLAVNKEINKDKDPDAGDHSTQLRRLLSKRQYQILKQHMIKHQTFAQTARDLNVGAAYVTQAIHQSYWRIWCHFEGNPYDKTLKELESDACT